MIDKEMINVLLIKQYDLKDIKELEKELVSIDNYLTYDCLDKKGNLEYFRKKVAQYKKYKPSSSTSEKFEIIDKQTLKLLEDVKAVLER
jgi:hypothetical protein